MKLPLSLAVALAAATLAAAPAHAAKKPAKPGDFNGDGRTDLAAGSPHWGFVTVRYAGGKAHRVLEDDGEWGARLASADFDRDGYADLVVTNRTSAEITVLYGSKKGLTGRTKKVTAPGDDPRLAIGDFNGDHRPDLAVTAETKGRLFPGLTGRPVTLDTSFYPEWAYGPIVPVAADYTGDGIDDLAYTFDQGCPGPSGDGPPDLSFAAGSKKGLGKPKSVSSDGAAYAATAFDVTRDGRADLVLSSCVEGAPSELRLLAGGPAGLRERKRIKAGVGSALAVGDVDRDGLADLVIGSPSWKNGTGRVTVRSGRTGRIRHLTENTKGVPGTAKAGDRFGASLSFADTTGDPRPELVIGAPYDDRPDGRLYTYDGRRFATLTAASLGLKGKASALGLVLL